MNKSDLAKGVVSSIALLDIDSRLAIAHPLLVELEAKGDITRWQSWDRHSVKEHGEEMAGRALSNAEIDHSMRTLNKEWNACSLEATDDFTDSLSVSLSGVIDSRHLENPLLKLPLDKHRNIGIMYPV